MIAKYPNFSKLELIHKDFITKLTNKFDPYSDFNFTSLYCWDTNNSTKISILNENLVISLPDYITGENVVSILGDNLIEESLNELLKNFHLLSLLPEFVRNEIIHKDNFVIVEDRDNFDYIVLSKELSDFSLNLPKKQKFIEQFETKYANVKVKQVDIGITENKKQILNVCEDWIKTNRINKLEARSEYTAIKRLLNNSSHLLEVKCIGLYDKNKLIAFNTYEVGTPNYGISSFQKADKSYDFVYSKLTSELAKAMLEINCNYINFEQDLGIEGLRNSKLSYHPVRFLKKYNVSLS